jgi:phenylalanyl-tRNA synthetase beta chain
VKISLRWLARHVDLAGLAPERIAEDLTVHTAEVEGLERFLPHLEAVVVGHVSARAKHPDADKLSVCTVDVGDGEPRQIVCGAPNVAAGQRVAVALPGVELPGDFKIKKSKIRGVESAGMICSERELGLGEESDGIWVLPPEARVGEQVAGALGLSDWVIEVDNKSITHRPDLWGHRGIARELAAIHGRALKPLELALPATGSGRLFPVALETSGCSRYVALAIDGVRARRSPDWLRALLLAAGQRPIDLLVDLSNFVMLDLGQPNHAFDRARIAAEGIVVRDARAGETLVTLDGVLRRLEPSDLLICAGAEPVALAGILGGEGSKVARETEQLLLEVACFEPARVRRTSQRLALRTDSSARFEKHLDPTLPMQAAAHFARLLKQIEPAASFPAPPTDVGRWTDPARMIALDPARARALLGADIPDADIAAILTRLGFGVEAKGTELAVRVPSARATKDVTIAEDLVEEVGRMHRYGRIAERALVADIAPPRRDAVWERRMLVRAIEDRLAGGACLREQISYSFLPDALVERLGEADLPHVTVQNAIDAGASRVRRSVLPSLLGLLEPNRRLADEVGLFEVGKGYLPERANERGEPAEVHEVALALALPSAERRFDDTGLARVRAILLDLLRALGVEGAREAPLEGAPRWAHPVRGVCLRAGDQALGFACELEPSVRRALGLTGDVASEVAAAVLSIDALLAAPRSPRKFEPLPRFPGVKVDVAAAVQGSARAADVAAAIEKAAKGLARSVELFDLYTGANVGAGRKSLAFHVLLQAKDRTLAEDDVQKFLQRVERELATLGAELRRA